MPAALPDERTLQAHQTAGRNGMLCDVACCSLPGVNVKSICIANLPNTLVPLLPSFTSWSFLIYQQLYITLPRLFVADQNHQHPKHLLSGLCRVTLTMHISLILTTLCATVFAAPFTQRFVRRSETNPTWQPLEGSKTTCDKTSNKIIGFYVGPQIESVLTNACAAMMPGCAYPDRLPEDKMCTQVIDWQLEGPKTSTQSANVETMEGNKISGWKVKCKSPTVRCIC